MSKLSKVDKLLKQLDDSYTKAWQEYILLHDEIKAYGNRALSEDEWNHALKILDQMETKFKEEINPVSDYITKRTQFATNTITSYYEFCKTLKEGGEQSKIIH